MVPQHTRWSFLQAISILQALDRPFYGHVCSWSKCRGMWLSQQMPSTQMGCYMFFICSLSLHDTAGYPSPPLESDPAQITACPSCSRGIKSCNQCTLMTAYPSGRTWTPSPCLENPSEGEPSFSDAGLHVWLLDDCRLHWLISGCYRYIDHFG